MSVMWLVMKTLPAEVIETFKCAKYARTECEFLYYNNFNLMQSLTVTGFLFFIPKGKFNRGVPTDMKKRTWAEITARVNEIGECQREVIEVIKKWSDLKCDTKRKVAAMRSGTVPNRGLNSRLSRDLNQTEKIVLQILEMDDEEQSSGDFGLLGEDDDVPEEEEELDEDDMIAMQSSPNGGLDMTPMPPPSSYKIGQSGSKGGHILTSFQSKHECIVNTHTCPINYCMQCLFSHSCN